MEASWISWPLVLAVAPFCCLASDFFESSGGGVDVSALAETSCSLARSSIGTGIDLGLCFLIFPFFFPACSDTATSRAAGFLFSDFFFFFFCLGGIFSTGESGSMEAFCRAENDNCKVESKGKLQHILHCIPGLSSHSPFPTVQALPHSLYPIQQTGEKIVTSPQRGNRLSSLHTSL